MAEPDQVIGRFHGVGADSVLEIRDPVSVLTMKGRVLTRNNQAQYESTTEMALEVADGRILMNIPKYVSQH
jgi:hypothetical protein